MYVNVKVIAKLILQSFDVIWMQLTSILNQKNNLIMNKLNYYCSMKTQLGPPSRKS